MDDHEIAETLRRCSRQTSRPLSVSREAERAAIDRGLLVYREWPAGHYQITERGRAFLNAA